MVRAWWIEMLPAGPMQGLAVSSAEPRRLGIDGAAEIAVAVMVEDLALVAARNAEQRAVLNGAIVHHHAHGAEVVIGVRVEGPVLVPLDGGTVAGGLHVELGGVEADGRAHQLLQDAQHLRMAHDAGIGVVLGMRALDPPDPGLGGAVAGLEVVDVVMLADRTRPLDEAVGDRAQRRHLVGREHALDDEEAFLAIGLDLTGRKLHHLISLR